jgi:hypothetical protein
MVSIFLSYFLPKRRAKTPGFSFGAGGWVTRGAGFEDVFFALALSGVRLS